MSEQEGPGWLADPPPPPPNPQDSPLLPPGGRRPGPPLAPGSGPGQRSPIGLKELREASPWVLGSVGIISALAIDWLADLLLTFQHAPGEPAQDRLLTLFGIGQVTWAMAVLLAAALLAAGRRFEIGTSTPATLRDTATVAVLAAAAAVGGCAAIDVLVELANLGHGIDRAISGLLAHLAVLPIVLAAAWWSLHLREQPL